MTKYFLVVGRIVGPKGVSLAMQAAKKMGAHLKIVGEFAGAKNEKIALDKLKSPNIEFLGRVSDAELKTLYANATAFLALGVEEDFGITPVEAMAAGCPIVAYKSGGYLETVVEGKTGTFFEEYNAGGLVEAIKRVEKMKIRKEDCQKQAEKFSKERFIEGMRRIINKDSSTQLID